MDIFLVIGGLLLCIVGIIGSVLPILPGPPISWIGLLLLQLTNAVEASYIFLGFTFLIAITIFILDYFIPAIGTKKFGGSRAGAIGTTIGLIVGLLSPIPFGILIGPFLGALVGEMAFNKTEGKDAIKAAFGSFLGLLASTFMKLTISTIFLGFFLWDVVQHWSKFF
ncbi:MAG: DUF456 domain-containing protein [Flavobacteriaceae bacterium]|nr:DUF456 domain-containing protein [Flavobacteriaceae bacterium]